MSKEIVVLTAGNILIGEVVADDKGVVITNASVIRVWGTTAGLGQIAVEGPTKDTILDYAGTVTAPMGSVVMRITCKVQHGAT